ncbi:MAG: hypothetical protein Q4F72_00555 [Desulfovibrionaceae bacterium]|nr:hypothetical protein [Desulfovibrionaceae bacterium]
MTDEDDRCLVREADGRSDADLRETALKLVRGEGELLFLTRFGSTLYGTRREGLSDTDLHGLYLPAQTPHGPGEIHAQKVLHLSTCPGTGRNTSADLDIEIFPLERWLLEFAAAGRISAVDLLHAPTRPSCTLHRHPALDRLFAEPPAFLGLASTDELVSYCLKQGNTYGLTGTRFGAIWRIARAVREMAPGMRLGAAADELISAARAPLYCGRAEDGGILLGGQWHAASIRIREMRMRADRLLKGHIKRIEAARRGEGVDWKALAHAVRAIRQHQSLLAEGRLVYPLACADELMPIRQGLVPFGEVDRLITEGLADAAQKTVSSPYAKNPDPGDIMNEARRIRAAVRPD